MRRFLVVVVLIAALASIIALFVVLSQQQPRPKLEVVPKPPSTIPAPAQSEGTKREQGTLKGKVIFGPTGEPMAGATVIALAPFLDAGEGDELPLWGEMMEKKRIKTGKDGTFRLEDLPPDYWNLWAEKEGFGFTTVPRAELKRDHVITLWPGCRVYGRVEYDDGTPAEGVSIEYTPQGMHSEVFSRYRLKSYYIRTDRNGRFEYTDLPPGKFTIEVYPDDHLPAPWTTEAPLQPGEERDLGKRVLDSGFGMTVRVKWRGTGEPVEGVEVVVRPVGDPMPRTHTGRRKRTGPDGIAKFAGLGGQMIPKPTFTVAAKIGGEVVIPDEGGMIQPNSDVTIYARRLAAILGKVERANGTPLKHFFLELKPKGFHTSQLRQWFRNTDRGKFKMQGLPEGAYKLVVRYPGLVDREIDIVAVAGKDTDVGTIVLHEGAEVWGTVRRASGKELPPVVRVVVAKKITKRDGKQVFWQTVGRVVVQKDGSYRIRGLPNGTYYIQPLQRGANLGTSEPEELTIRSASDTVQRNITMYGEGYVDLAFYDLVRGSRTRVIVPPCYLIRKADGEETRWQGNRTPLRPGTYSLQVELQDENGVPKRHTIRDPEAITVQEDETTGPIEVSLHEIRDAE
ncbi:MAG: carboxypeptidase-like regulatory domain-containing protein [Planctomycetota bacterium]|jgi:hypothetical protein